MMSRSPAAVIGSGLVAIGFLLWMAWPFSSPKPFPANLGNVEVVARLTEVPEGAVFERELYHYATILKYEVISCARGKVLPGDILYVAHYDPWKPRAAAADAKAPGIGGDVRAFVAGDRHHLALAIPLDDHYMGGLVDKYFGRRPPLTYWALRTDAD
jgi:hypothetical protein